MNSTIVKTELLSPAGSPDCLEVAVACGADAVYLGLDEFSARARAVNFNRDNLKHYISFCHNRNVKVYITLNILLYDDEMERALKAACFARNSGVDAIIVQDMGLYSLLKQQMPDLPIHASTQMSITSADGAKILKNYGFDRVILAREMSYSEISKATATGIETEVFIHGARCYSYSGQCLMSSMLGGRSGNRGLCAQPCRLPYTLSDEKNNILLQGHLLSLKDTLYLSELASLKKAGISALKIEGRMKGVEYVSTVTSIYRKYLDMETPVDIEKIDMDDLLKAFNREGFSKGALSSKPGQDEFASTTPSDSGFPVGRVIKGGILGSYTLFEESISKDDGLRIGTHGGYAERDIVKGTKAVVPIEGRPGDTVYRTRDNSFNKKYNFSNAIKRLNKIPVIAHATIKIGENPYMEVWDSDGNSGSYTLENKVETAKSNGTAPSRIRDQLMKTGATDYEITEFDFQCDEGIYIKISDINELRRRTLDALYEKRTGIPSEISCEIPLVSTKMHMTSEPGYSLLMYNIPPGFDPSDAGIRRIYLDIENCKNDIERIRSLCIANNIEFFLHIPFSANTVPSQDCDGYLIENIGMLDKLPLDKVILGSGFNISNSYAISQYKGVLGITLSHEMSLDRITALDNFSKTPLEVTIYGNLQVMESPYCPARDICNGSLCSDKQLRLTDRMDETWEIIYNKSRHSVRIFNPHKLMAFDKLDSFSLAGIDLLRFNITDESNDEILKLLEFARKGRVPHVNPSHKYTNGRF